MLKILAMFALAFCLVSVQTNAQTHKVQKNPEGDKPSLAAAPIAPQQDDRTKLPPEHQEHVDTDVRVVSTPAKDGYDKASVWINLALAIIGAVGICGAYITLRKLERQTKATEDAVVEAKTSRSLAEDTAKRQLRAYVGLVITACWNLESNGPLGIKFVAINYGQTPASHFNGVGVIDYLPYPLPEDFVLPEPPTKVHQDAIIFPNDRANPLIVSFWEREGSRKTIQEKLQLLSKQATIEAYAHGKITYKDVFGQEWCVEFCHFLNPQSVRTNDNGEMVREADGNLTFQWAPVAGRNRFS
jgi:hypothetical protein